MIASVVLRENSRNEETKQHATLTTLNAASTDAFMLNRSVKLATSIAVGRMASSKASAGDPPVLCISSVIGLRSMNPRLPVDRQGAARKHANCQIERCKERADENPTDNGSGRAATGSIRHVVASDECHDWIQAKHHETLCPVAPHIALHNYGNERGGR